MGKFSIARPFPRIWLIHHGQYLELEELRDIIFRVVLSSPTNLQLLRLLAPRRSSYDRCASTDSKANCEGNLTR